MSDNDHCPLPGGGITTPDQPLISFTARSEHLETRGVDNLTAGGDGKIVILKNFVIICPPGHRLDTLSLNVIGPDQGEAPTKLTMKNVSETKWECPSSVHMSWDTATLKLAACSDCDEDLGFVVLKKDDMLSLIPEDQGMPVYHVISN
ncbi:hypothetical protein NLJ89_g7807 [Agrocybe chaxingu]|uniref:Uncharacterized protein n=1 Tax=Agrocybe chaxingu TaxID=84603 RepID=A0A9W8MTC0_9AGAR|nr:hypothetical protein NLJ89_g7807 [Agrocybe chaxingu]